MSSNELMAILDDYKEQLPDGLYLTMSNTLMKRHKSEKRAYDYALKNANTEIRRLKRRFKYVEHAVAQFTEDGKAHDLYWLSHLYNEGRSMHKDEKHPMFKRVQQVMKDYPKESKRIMEGDRREAGFWSGVVASGRLFGGLSFPTVAEEQACDEEEMEDLDMEKLWEAYTEEEKDEVEERNVEGVWEAFPSLDEFSEDVEKFKLEDAVSGV